MFMNPRSISATAGAAAFAKHRCSSFVEPCRWFVATALKEASATSTKSIAIVGSGPSGCYTAKYLMQSSSSTTSKSKSKSKWNNQHDFRIDILDRLPTPFGLVRFGVAPDHPEVKNVQNDFTALFEQPNVNFYGNVRVGQDVSLQELRHRYDAVVLAYGCESDRKLEIPHTSDDEPSGSSSSSSDNAGVLSAREFVAWYNGHPDFGHIGPIVQQALSPRCNGTSKSNIVIIGQGNVALDCARILAKTKDALNVTDITTEALNSHAIRQQPQQEREIHVLGRRGHIQASFTIKELRELTKLEDDCHARCIVREEELELGSTESSLQELKSLRPKKRIDKLLRDVANSTADHDDVTTQQLETSIHLRFLLQPNEFQFSKQKFKATDEKWITKVKAERTRLEGEAKEQKAIPTGELEEIDADLVLVSIGYKGTSIDGTEDFFDTGKGILTNAQGKVDGSTEESAGLYVAGWLKRGPSGIIGSNIADAKETVASILSDLTTDSSTASTDANERNPDLWKNACQDLVTWDMYKKIDATETAAKQLRNDGQPRNKLTTIPELLDAANAK